ncbi:MAG: zinc transporter ZupT [Aeromicrobium sp.]|nr:zinc transporter ZupT [Aeromicrobium sp.]
MAHEVWIAFGLTLVAGMATGIGSLIAFTAKRTDYRFLSIATGFSAGVMLYVAFIEILPEGAEALTVRYGEALGPWVNAAAFFGGIAAIALIDNLIPEATNPHEIHSEAETGQLREAAGGPAHGAGPHRPFEAEDAPERATHPHGSYGLLRAGLFTALAITIHNLPEGLATFLAALEDPALGVAIAVAIALHNIPEGVSVSVPIYYATGDRKKAFWYSMFSGLAEPAGAVIAYLALVVLSPGTAMSVPPEVMGIAFAGVAGVMVYISIDELLPTSRAYGRGHDSILGVMAGMLVMALTLLLMR